METRVESTQPITYASLDEGAAVKVSDLVETMRRGLIELQPMEDRPSAYLMWTGVHLRESLRNQSWSIVPQTVYQLSSHFCRSASFFIETLALDPTGIGEPLCVYAIFPGAVEGSDRAILHHATAIHRDVTPGYKYALVAVFRQSLTEMGEAKVPASVLGSVMHEVGAYTVSSEENSAHTHKLYVAVWRMTPESPSLSPV